ncbi:pyridoxamine 5'-phosphate oxidase family protein [Holophaga foetida]|uniref:pyridoxamine 5'-phosphate oxidase family protein n=1 Tax=Holophaga foetida TaxID=35839 RepID=UPI0002473330|nr:pyridoxamine 5'-phosphate oxidase family protein [Holophaga foetida]
MSTALAFLKSTPAFFVGTADGNRGRVRPFSFVMKRNGAMYFCTNVTKDVYKQLQDNGEMELSAMNPGGEWIRIRGKVAFDASREAKAQAFEEAPNLLRLYPKGADDEAFTTFFFTEAEATLFSFTAPPKQLPLV